MWTEFCSPVKAIVMTLAFIFSFANHCKILSKAVILSDLYSCYLWNRLRVGGGGERVI